MDFKGLQALLGMMSEAVRGSAEAKKAFDALTKRPGSAQDVLAWIRRFVPMGGNPLRPELLGQQIEDAARVLGFVPRSRYVDLLEQNEILRHKLADAEQAAQRLQAMVATGGNEGTAKKLLDGISATVDGTLKIQAELFRSITDIFTKPEVKPATEAKPAEDAKPAKDAKPAVEPKKTPETSSKKKSSSAAGERGS